MRDGGAQDGASGGRAGAQRTEGGHGGGLRLVPPSDALGAGALPLISRAAVRQDGRLAGEVHLPCVKRRAAWGRNTDAWAAMRSSRHHGNAGHYGTMKTARARSRRNLGSTNES